ncbi:MAG: hypothetical protein RL701_4864 [Pseudomonadota bacterium]|jgi:hypothetical protein
MMIGVLLNTQCWAAIVSELMITHDDRSCDLDEQRATRPAQDSTEADQLTPVTRIVLANLNSPYNVVFARCDTVGKALRIAKPEGRPDRHWTRVSLTKRRRIRSRQLARTSM